MTRFSLSNPESVSAKIKSMFSSHESDAAQISHEQFLKLTIEFAYAVKREFDSDISIQICALRSPRRVQTVDNFLMQELMDTVNAEATILETDNLVNIHEDLWNQSGYVDVVMRPITKTAESQFAMIEYKGLLPLTASFCYQCGLGKMPVIEYMQSKNSAMILGDGWASNAQVRPPMAKFL